MTTEALERQLANDEPKCGNCKHWDQMIEVPHLGGCLNITMGGSSGTKAGHTYSGQIPVTVDLAVCSKWETGSMLK